MFLLSTEKIRRTLRKKPYLIPSFWFWLAKINYDAGTILKKLNGLNVSKSPGPDLVNAKILKESDEPIVPVLSIMFKTSYETGRLPTKWKEVNISTIYKRADKHDMENYHLISLKRIICKFKESLINSVVSNASFLYPLKTSENLTLMFSGDRERAHWEWMD